jgi:hypothetical protein
LGRSGAGGSNRSTRELYPRSAGVRLAAALRRRAGARPDRSESRSEAGRREECQGRRGRRRGGEAAAGPEALASPRRAYGARRPRKARRAGSKHALPSPARSSPTSTEAYRGMNPAASIPALSSARPASIITRDPTGATNGRTGQAARLIDGDRRGDVAEGNVESARQRRGERVREPPRGVEEEAGQRGRSEREGQGHRPVVGARVRGHPRRVARGGSAIVA